MAEFVLQQVIAVQVTFSTARIGDLLVNRPPHYLLTRPYLSNTRLRDHWLPSRVSTKSACNHVILISRTKNTPSSKCGDRQQGFWQYSQVQKGCCICARRLQSNTVIDPHIKY